MRNRWFKFVVENFKSTLMNHINALISNSLLSGVLWVLLAICAGQNASAQSVQTFKVESPAEAKPLVKDSINNFLSFAPVFAEGKTYLRWLVENDKKDGVFIIERSSDGDSFEALGFKDRVGTDKQVNLFYSYVDDAPPAGFAHYRIMQVGTDHSFNYSSTVKVKTAPAPNTGGNASVGEEAPAEK
jgi:hypothetical protein